MICFITFNYFDIRGTPNGPGTSLWGLTSILKRKNIDYIVFSKFNSGIANSKVKHISDIPLYKDLISKCEYVVIWSGASQRIDMSIHFDFLKGKKVIFGPNMMDGVNPQELSCYNAVQPSKIMVTNSKIKFILNEKYKFELNKIYEFMSPPDLSFWRPNKKKEDLILWKGNSSHEVKNFVFAKMVESKLNKENIVVLNNYDYFKHIDLASSASVYFSTSISETISMTLLEQLSSGVPSIINPGHFLWGENYKTTIMSNLNVNEYVDKIKEIYYNKTLQNYMSEQSVEWIKQNFSDDVVLNKFIKTLEA